MTAPDARRIAEETLTKWGTPPLTDARGYPYSADATAIVNLAAALRALLASDPPAGETTITPDVAGAMNELTLAEMVATNAARRDRGEAPMHGQDAFFVRAFAQEPAPAQPTRPELPGHDRISELESLLRECNAVCLCGCPDSEHESYGEDGESCGHDDHECIRVAPAVLAYVNGLRTRGEWAARRSE